MVDLGVKARRGRRLPQIGLDSIKHGLNILKHLHHGLEQRYTHNGKEPNLLAMIALAAAAGHLLKCTPLLPPFGSISGGLMVFLVSASMVQIRKL